MADENKTVKICPLSSKDDECFNWCRWYIEDQETCAINMLAVGLNEWCKTFYKDGIDVYRCD